MGCLLGWVYGVTSACSTSAAEAREKALMISQAQEFTQKHLECQDKRLSEIEKSVRSIDAGVNQIKGQLGISSKVSGT
jgi:hypothetical protein